jgi:hypothetical protein
MDNSRFDALTRVLSTVGSRRGTIGGLLAGVLGLLHGAEPDAAIAHNTLKKCKKIEDKDKKRQCVKKAKKHRAQHAAPACTPTCGGTVCGGDNGCGGSCGTCSAGAVCQGGQCVNGTLAVGASCTKALPRECVSGVCGCVGASCTCRNANCVPDDVCFSDAECCSGFCNSPRCMG